MNGKKKQKAQSLYFFPYSEKSLNTNNVPFKTPSIKFDTMMESKIKDFGAVFGG